MEALQAIESNKNIPVVKVWNGQRVVTLGDVDKVHKRPKGTAKKNFQNNRKHFILNVDYFELTRKELWENFSLKSEPLKGNPQLKTFLFTETGYLMLVKSFNDDLSWSVQRQLVTGYFRGKELERRINEQYKQNAPQQGNYPSLVNKWMREQEPNFRLICKAYGISRRELYHKILLDIGDEYSVDDYRVYYKRDTGHGAEYIMDVVAYYPELRESAEIAIEIHLRRIRTYPQRYLN